MSERAQVGDMPLDEPPEWFVDDEPKQPTLDELGLKVSDLVWVSCSQELSWDVARCRHLIRPASKRQAGGTTLCGSTQSTGSEFRVNKSKPNCPKCLELVK